MRSKGGAQGVKFLAPPGIWYTSSSESPKISLFLIDFLALKVCMGHKIFVLRTAKSIYRVTFLYLFYSKQYKKLEEMCNFL